MEAKVIGRVAWRVDRVQLPSVALDAAAMLKRNVKIDGRDEAPP
jgi:hypothetical protein